jgi:hypothetical protein
MRRARKTTRTRQELREGQPVTLRVHTYHCAQCGSFLYSNEQILETGGTPPAEAEEPADTSPVAPSPGDAPAV